jgi:hypothetical protein
LIHLSRTRLAKNQRFPMCLIRGRRTSSGAQQLPKVRFAEPETQLGEAQIFCSHFGLLRCNRDAVGRQGKSKLRLRQAFAQAAFESLMIAASLRQRTSCASHFSLRVASSPEWDA